MKTERQIRRKIAELEEKLSAVRAKEDSSIVLSVEREIETLKWVLGEN